MNWSRFWKKDELKLVQRNFIIWGSQTGSHYWERPWQHVILQAVGSWSVLDFFPRMYHQSSKVYLPVSWSAQVKPLTQQFPSTEISHNASVNHLNHWTTDEKHSTKQIDAGSHGVTWCQSISRVDTQCRTFICGRLWCWQSILQCQQLLASPGNIRWLK